MWGISSKEFWQFLWMFRRFPILAYTETLENTSTGKEIPGEKFKNPVETSTA